MKHYKLLLLIFAFILQNCVNPSQENIDFVDPFIGTGGHGHTFPGATVPFGMVQLSPSHGWKSWDWCSGYHYSDSIIKGFAHNHISGAGLAGLGDILVMPSNQMHLQAGTEEDVDAGYMSRFSHKNEKASAGYYSVLLDDPQVKVELTTSKRIGYHRYTFLDAGEGYVIIDPTHQIMESIQGSELEILSDTEIRGYKHTEGEGGNRKTYFYAKFSKPFTASGLAQGGKALSDQKQLNHKNTLAWTKFQVKRGEQIELKVALSMVNYEGAKKNYEAEIKVASNFDQALAQAQNLWREKLNKISITGSNTQKRIFYTALYHSFISPNLISDIDGQYVIEGKTYQSEFDQYSNFSTWDTFRALHPLFTIIEQDKTADFVNSLSSRYSVSKVGLPVWELMGHDNVCMIGYSTTSPMADAILKDIPGIDQKQAYEAMKAAAFSFEKHSPNYDKNGMQYYVNLGYVPGDIGSSISKTTEQNYYDWAIGQVAQKLEQDKDALMFDERSRSHLNLFHPEKKYLMPKALTGEWQEVGLNHWDKLIPHYVSGNIWGYSSYVPHYMAGVIDKMGGREKYADWLNRVFTNQTQIEGAQHVDISGFIGKYAHGEESSQHMPYLYNYLGQPWKTQEIIREITHTFYKDTPDGLINNEDLGQMSSWYIFSTLGFYPVCPGSKQYIIGSPHYKEARINTESGNVFTIKAPQASSKNIYIQSVKLNGKSHHLPFITHEQIMQGGVLEFELGTKPSQWGTDETHVCQIYGNNTAETQSITLKEVVFTPFTKNNKQVFADQKEILLTCNTPDAVIRYTLDGTEPNAKSTVYQKPIQVNSDVILKAKAFHDELGESTIFEQKFFKSITAKLQNKYPRIDIDPKPTKYGAADGSFLKDGLMGSYNFNDKHWTGLDEEKITFTIDLGSPQTISQMTLSYLVDTKVWIFPPEQISISTSADSDIYQEVKVYSPQSLKSDLQAVQREKVTFPIQKARYIRLEVSTLKIPSWHFGNGNQAWFFIDEVLIN